MFISRGVCCSIRMEIGRGVEENGIIVMRKFSFV